MSISILCGVKQWAHSKRMADLSARSNLSEAEKAAIAKRRQEASERSRASVAQADQQQQAGNEFTKMMSMRRAQVDGVDASVERTPTQLNVISETNAATIPQARPVVVNQQIRSLDLAAGPPQPLDEILMVPRRSQGPVVHLQPCFCPLCRQTAEHNPVAPGHGPVSAKRVSELKGTLRAAVIGKSGISELQAKLAQHRASVDVASAAGNGFATVADMKPMLSEHSGMAGMAEIQTKLARRRAALDSLVSDNANALGVLPSSSSVGDGTSSMQFSPRTMTVIHEAPGPRRQVIAQTGSATGQRAPASKFRSAVRGVVGIAALQAQIAQRRAALDSPTAAATPQGRPAGCVVTYALPLSTAVAPPAHTWPSAAMAPTLRTLPAQPSPSSAPQRVIRRSLTYAAVPAAPVQTVQAARLTPRRSMTTGIVQ